MYLTKTISNVNKKGFLNMLCKRIGVSSLIADSVMISPKCCYTNPAGIPGAGAGKGGGAGGSVRESGGGLGKFAAANEEGYFFNQQKKQLEKLREKLKSEPQKEPAVTQKEDK